MTETSSPDEPQIASGATQISEQRGRRRAFLGATAGHLIEWYDYGVYGFLAVYIGQAFFASDDPAVSLISSFAVFALSFFVRPLGGLFFGPISDRMGRKRALLIVLILMAGSTFAIGLLPTSASIGWFAPLLLVLVRCVQGFSAGGEVGTIAAFIAEYAGPARRGFSTSWLMVTGVLGLVLGGLIANGLVFLLGAESMQAGGWRIPFLIAGPLGLIGVYIRMKLEDTPEFLRLVANDTRAKAPLREVMKWKRAMGLVFTVIALHASAFYLLLTFSTTFMSTHLGFSSGTTLLYVFGASTLSAVVMPFAGTVTDRYGRKWFMFIVAVLSILAFIWFFVAAEGATPLSFLAPLLAVAILFGCYVSSTFALMTDLLPTHIRSTGIAIAFNLPIAIFGGTAPMIATALIAATGNSMSPAVFFAGTGLLAACGLALLRRRDFERSEAASAAVLAGPELGQAR